MRRYDANPAASAFAVTFGAAFGVVLAVVLGLNFLGLVVLAVIGVLAAGLVASTLGLVGERDRGERSNEDLPPEYDDY